MARTHSWVRSLQCKSRAFEDVSSSTCRSGSQALKDVVCTARQKHRKPYPGRGPPPTQPLGSNNNKPKIPRKEELAAPPPLALHIRSPVGVLYPALIELPEEHSSRKVVEIIFRSSWDGGMNAFTGQVEMILKIHNGRKASARFEKYREAVKFCARISAGSGGAQEENGRCMADGNEVMRFQCLGPIPPFGGEADNHLAWLRGGLRWGKAAALCTFSGSGRAHESVGKSGGGRRAMLICRVIAGRVANGVGADPFGESRLGFDSVSREDGELLVYDSRAVLPCFLIIYIL
ncbi:hypothetical protein SAY87_015133 [Trapa incisa]|uniref:Uncharacterized protein n=1 Tax=Trapa incisa TaxID=236973 RepID=A0AAN7GX96_9MYRT|nr:hypothetical protein SAY87_015133 [Trapa incisa]